MLFSKKWKEVTEKYSYGDLLEGVVVHHAPFGVFLNIGEEEILGFVRIVNFLDVGRMTPDKYPVIGEKVNGIIVEFTEHNKQVCLSLKPSDLLKYS